MGAAKRVVITGGASGYGKALALQFASEGWRVAFMDIHAARGAETAAELLRLYPASDVFFVQGDVRELSSFESLRDAVVRRWGGLDMLINNAGVAAHGRIDESQLDDWQWIIDINLLSVVRGSQVFLPLLKAQGSGHVVNIASMAGLLYGAEMGPYNATKAGVVAISETLLFELKPAGIKVSVVCPGFFQTNLAETMRLKNPEVKARVERLLASSKLSAAEIAAFTYKELLRGSFLILPHPLYQKFWRMKRFLPSLYYHLMHKRAAGRQSARS